MFLHLSVILCTGGSMMSLPAEPDTPPPKDSTSKDGIPKDDAPLLKNSSPQRMTPLRMATPSTPLNPPSIPPSPPLNSYPFFACMQILSFREKLESIT